MQKIRQLQRTYALDTIAQRLTNEEKIAAILEKQEQTLENLQTNVKDLKHGQQEQTVALIRLEQGQTQLKTLLKVLQAGQNDIRENIATKADVQEIKVELEKQQRQ